MMRGASDRDTVVMIYLRNNVEERHLPVAFTCLVHSCVVIYCLLSSPSLPSSLSSPYFFLYLNISQELNTLGCGSSRTWLLDDNIELLKANKTGPS